MAVAACVALAVALVGGAATDTGPWYQRLDKSPLTPPDWLFAPVWTLIYALTVWSAVLGYGAARTHRERSRVISLFFINAVLNVLWSAAFFTLRRPDWALAEVATLWLSVLVLIGVLWRPAPRAAGLLIPHLLWVSLAAYLNYEVVVRNGPFR